MQTFSESLKSGRFVVTAELNPPKGTDLGALFKHAQALNGMVDAFNLTDSAGANMTMSPTAAAHLMRDRGIEPILQVTGRDRNRNRIALEADMLVASALGITNILCMSGDPPGRGDHPDAVGVVALKAETLLQAVGAMNAGADMYGNRLKSAPLSRRRRQPRRGRSQQRARPHGGEGATGGGLLPDAGGLRRRVIRNLHANGARLWRARAGRHDRAQVGANGALPEREAPRA